MQRPLTLNPCCHSRTLSPRRCSQDAPLASPMFAGSHAFQYVTFTAPSSSAAILYNPHFDVVQPEPIFHHKVDLDLRNYDQFLDVKLTRDHNITTGKIYQVAHHVTDAMQEYIERVAALPADGNGCPADVCVVEFGGTIVPLMKECGGPPCAVSAAITDRCQTLVVLALVMAMSWLQLKQLEKRRSNGFNE